MNTALTATVARELGQELADALTRIEHCVDQLSAEQVWHRAADDRNSIGNLLLHLAGNVRQWIICNLSGVPDDRDRPAEFAQRDALPVEQVRAKLLATVAEAKGVLERLSDADWLRPLRIQRFDTTGFGAALHAVSHFRGHTQEIIHQTRDLLGERYRFAWVPRTPEEGAPQESV